MLREALAALGLGAAISAACGGGLDQDADPDPVIDSGFGGSSGTGAMSAGGAGGSFGGSGGHSTDASVDADADVGNSDSVDAECLCPLTTPANGEPCCIPAFGECYYWHCAGGWHEYSKCTDTGWQSVAVWDTPCEPEAGAD